jgi:NADPH:quinone reductase-like Zn-dependent oxidoreductase
MPSGSSATLRVACDASDVAQSCGMGSMRAAVRDRYGAPDVVRVEEIERPEPKDDELLVRVAAASVNRADLDGIRPKPQFVRLFLGLRAPRNRRIGLDVAGTVEAVGAGVTRFKPGDRVFADLYPARQGAFAELVTAPERAFAAIPDDLSFEDAATLPHAGILAVQGLRTRKGRTLRPGDKVLIDGASGNVGPFAVQIAKSMGAEVTGVCRGSKVEFVRSLGADHVIDYTTTDYTQTGERYDWILAADSHYPVLKVRHALKAGGVYVTLGGDGRSILSAVILGAVVSAATDRSVGLMWWWRPFAADDVATLVRLVAEGKVRPFIDRRYPLDQIVDALRWVDDGHARGKVVVIAPG